MRTATALLSLTLLTACMDNNSSSTKMSVPGQRETIAVNKLGENHWQTYTDIVIDASLENVWAVLTDWDKLSTWSSSLQGITGKVENKGTVHVSYLVAGAVYETPHRFVYQHLEEFGWSDPMTGSFEGLTDNHRFRVERISDHQTRFIQSDEFKGSGNKTLSAEDVANQTVGFFPSFNRELKIEVEKRYGE